MGIPENVGDVPEKINTEVDETPKKKELATVKSKKDKATPSLKTTDQKGNDKTKNKEEAVAFPVKLKKAEQIKRAIAEPKIETVQLKHHAFEGLPQEPEKEKLTNVILKLPLED